MSNGRDKYFDKSKTKEQNEADFRKRFSAKTKEYNPPIPPHRGGKVPNYPRFIDRPKTLLEKLEEIKKREAEARAKKAKPTQGYGTGQINLPSLPMSPVDAPKVQVMVPNFGRSNPYVSPGTYSKSHSFENKITPSTK